VHESNYEFLVSSFPSPGVQLLELNHPAKRNCLSKAVLRELADALQNAQSEPDIRVVVLTGQTEFFSAGADVSDMAARGVEAYLDPDRLRYWQTVENFRKPLIAAVNGFAFGGGFELALLADIIIAGANARFALPEVKIGAIPGDGGTQRLPRLIGKSRAMRMILSGEAISADQALREGVVSEVVDPSLTVMAAISLAKTIAERPAQAVALAKEAVLESMRPALGPGLLKERELVIRVFETDDRSEGHRAFVEKRAPRFQHQ
jgi:enoyl-CoA hydratase